MIFNKSTNRIISKKEIVCRSILSQARGLMFRKKHNLVMIFPKERTISLHNFFVFYPIEVIVLNEEMQVVEIKENFMPFTFWKSKEKGMYLIEMGNDKINDKMKNNIKIGDKLKIN